MTYDDNDGPVGFLGKLRTKKALTWILIIGLVALSIGATTIIVILQSVNASR
jgi:hypothetical protein